MSVIILMALMIAVTVLDFASTLKVGKFHIVEGNPIARKLGLRGTILMSVVALLMMGVPLVLLEGTTAFNVLYFVVVGVLIYKTVIVVWNMFNLCLRKGHFTKRGD